MDPYEPPLAESQPGPAPADTVWRGVVQVLCGHLAALFVVALFNLRDLQMAGILTFFFIGLGQWLYVIPLLLVDYSKGRRQTAKGVWIMAGVTLLPTCACFGTLALSSGSF